jgi:hypothetical protein
MSSAKVYSVWFTRFVWVTIFVHDSDGDVLVHYKTVILGLDTSWPIGKEFYLSTIEEIVLLLSI